MLTVDDKDVARHAAAANGPSAPSRLAQTIDHQRADDLVQEIWVRAFAEDPEGAENASEHVRGLFSPLLCRR